MKKSRTRILRTVIVFALMIGLNLISAVGLLPDTGTVARLHLMGIDVGPIMELIVQAQEIPGCLNRELDDALNSCVSAFDNCLETEATEDTCVKNFEICTSDAFLVWCEVFSSTGGSSSASIRDPDQPCPPGTQPGTLGQCVTVFQPHNAPRDVDPNDHCGPGTVPGPNDACVPIVYVMNFVPGSDGDGWYFSCPPGTKPGPIGGCVVSFSDRGLPQTENLPHRCPPGTSPAPDDGGCIPIIQTMNQGNLFGLKGLIKARNAEVLNVENFELVNERGALSYYLLANRTHDVTNALERTAQSLGAEYER